MLHNADSVCPLPNMPRVERLRCIEQNPNAKELVGHSIQMKVLALYPTITTNCEWSYCSFSMGPNELASMTLGAEIDVI